ncbi:MAG: acyl-CoA thioesterase [Candidatus Sumerlaeota bacterium]
MARRRRSPLPFKIEPDAPPPLEATAERRVRFQEVDPLGIVWHGHYASFFEDARVAFGDRYGLSYLQMRDSGFSAPIVQMTVDYLSPLAFDQVVTVRARAHWSEVVRLHFEYEIFHGHQETAAWGATVQALVDLEGDPLLTWPEFMQDFRARWEKGDLSDA